MAVEHFRPRVFLECVRSIVWSTAIGNVTTACVRAAACVPLWACRVRAPCVPLPRACVSPIPLCKLCYWRQATIILVVLNISMLLSAMNPDPPSPLLAFSLQAVLRDVDFTSMVPLLGVNLCFHTCAILGRALANLVCPHRRDCVIRCLATLSLESSFCMIPSSDMLLGFRIWPSFSWLQRKTWLQESRMRAARDVEFTSTPGRTTSAGAVNSVRILNASDGAIWVFSPISILRCSSKLLFAQNQTQRGFAVIVLVLITDTLDFLERGCGGSQLDVARRTHRPPLTHTEFSIRKKKKLVTCVAQTCIFFDLPSWRVGLDSKWVKAATVFPLLMVRWVISRIADVSQVCNRRFGLTPSGSSLRCVRSSWTISNSHCFYRRSGW